MHSKFEQLQNYLTNLDKQGICLAFSGGVDSSLLLFLCRNLNILAVTFKSVFQTGEEIVLTQEFCKKYGVKQEIIEYFPLENPYIVNNPKDRCYHCKKAIFTGINDIAGQRTVIDGTNFDDLNVYRPGLNALKECGVVSPFAKFKITKQEIRDYAREIGLEFFDKPSSPCLATRFPYGVKLSRENLEIAEKGEQILKNYGFKNCRLRLHGNVARIEISQNEFERFLAQKDITQNLKTLGIKYVTLDVEGLRSGSMDF